jgi:chromosome segregation ATPase
MTQPQENSVPLNDFNDLVEEAEKLQAEKRILMQNHQDEVDQMQDELESQYNRLKATENQLNELKEENQLLEGELENFFKQKVPLD